MIAPIHLADEHTPQPIPPVNDDDDDDDDMSKPGSGGGNIDPDDDDEGDDDEEDDDEETLWTLKPALNTVWAAGSGLHIVLAIVASP
jgi:hypothetical protein